MTEELYCAENKKLAKQIISAVGYKGKRTQKRSLLKTVTEESFPHSGDLFRKTMTLVTGQTKKTLLVSINFRTAAKGQILENE